MYWEILGAFLTGVGSVVAAAWVIRAVVRHEKEVSDARIEAFKDGLQYQEKLNKGGDNG